MSIAKILLVEDNFYINQAIKDRLEHNGYRVFSFEDGMQANNFITSNTPWLAVGIKL